MWKSYKIVQKYQNISELPRKLPSDRTSAVSGIQIGNFVTRKLGGGLLNLGNSCYFNAAFQALVYVPVIFNFLQSDYVRQHLAKCKNNNCVLCPMAITLTNTLSCSPIKPSIAPRLLYGKLKIICGLLRPGMQEDSHELLV